MSRDAAYQRLLSLEIRSSKIGFAVIQGTDLVDWGCLGVFSSDTTGREKAMKILAFLLKTDVLTIVIARRTRRVSICLPRKRRTSSGISKLSLNAALFDSLA